MYIRIDLSKYGPSKKTTLMKVLIVSKKMTFGLTVLDNDKMKLKLKYLLPGLYDGLEFPMLHTKFRGTRSTSS